MNEINRVRCLAMAILYWSGGLKAQESTWAFENMISIQGVTTIIGNNNTFS